MTTLTLVDAVVAPDPFSVVNPLIPFAVSGGPSPDVLVTEAQLTEAYLRFCSCYGDSDHEAIRRGAQKALAAVTQRDRWTVLPDGVLELRGSGSDTYLVSDEDCRIKGRTAKKGRPVLCPSYVFGQGTHGGQCYHTIAREIIRIAQTLARQALDADTALAPRSLPRGDLDSGLAFVTLAADELAAACFLACRAGTPIRFSVKGGDLHIRAGRRSLTLDGQDGAGVGVLDVAAADAATLRDALCPVARQIPSIQVFIDRELRIIHLCAAGDATFSVDAPGTPT